jgi:hypothetical protein
VEVDGIHEVLNVAEPASRVLHPWELRVETFAGRVGGSLLEAGQDVRQSLPRGAAALQGVAAYLDGTRRVGPVVPNGPAHGTSGTVVPSDAEWATDTGRSTPPPRFDRSDGGPARRTSTPQLNQPADAC